MKCMSGVSGGWVPRPGAATRPALRTVSGRPGSPSASAAHAVHLRALGRGWGTGPCCLPPATALSAAHRRSRDGASQGSGGRVMRASPRRPAQLHHARASATIKDKRLGPTRHPAPSRSDGASQGWVVCQVADARAQRRQGADRRDDFSPGPVYSEIRRGPVSPVSASSRVSRPMVAPVRARWGSVTRDSDRAVDAWPRGRAVARVRYSLPMTTKVKSASAGTRAAGRSRVSSKHQITIPIAAFSEAGLREGDLVQVKASGPGRVVIARVDDLIDEFAGALRTSGELGRALRGLRREWD